LFRYTFELEKSAVPADVVTNKTAMRTAVRGLRKSLRTKYMEGKNKWFFTRLRF
jgi:hypothetical protein